MTTKTKLLIARDIVIVLVGFMFGFLAGGFYIYIQSGGMK
jgi:uncharacterized membrane protein